MASKKVRIDMGQGKPALSFNRGGLHRSTHTPQGQPIPASKLAAASRGDYGPKAVKQASLAKSLRKMGG